MPATASLNQIEIDRAAQHDHLARMPGDGLALQIEDAQVLRRQAPGHTIRSLPDISPVTGRRHRAASLSPGH
jgi:hypothetical protein